MGDRERFGSGAPWESLYGYSRAVRVGRQVRVAGTTAVDKTGKVVAPGGPYAQTDAVLDGD